MRLIFIQKHALWREEKRGDRPYWTSENTFLTIYFTEVEHSLKLQQENIVTSKKVPV